MRAPSSKTLIEIAVFSFIGFELLMPDFYPAAIPVVGSDGLAIYGTDGKILVHRDMARLYRAMIPSEILFLCSAASILWLLVRLFIFINGRFKNHTTVA